MDCTAFRDQHVGFMDGVLDDAELLAMQRHVADCRACAAHDISVRRAIMVFRNLPSIQPSPDFATRLDARLRGLSTPSSARSMGSLIPMPRLGTFTATALGVAAVGYLAILAFREPARDHDSAFRPLAVAAAPSDSPTAQQPDDSVIPIASVAPRTRMHFVATHAPGLITASIDSPTIRSPFTSTLLAPSSSPASPSPMWTPDITSIWARRPPMRLGDGEFTAVRLSR